MYTYVFSVCFSKAIIIILLLTFSVYLHHQSKYQMSFQVSTSSAKLMRKYTINMIAGKCYHRQGWPMGPQARNGPKPQAWRLDSVTYPMKHSFRPPFILSNQAHRSIEGPLRQQSKFNMFNSCCTSLNVSFLSWFTSISLMPPPNLLSSGCL